jgi:hypothetical protein
VGTPTGSDADQLVRDWLSVLLPLELPDPGESRADAFGELAKHLPENLDPSVRTLLLEAASHGDRAVSTALRQLVVEALGEDESGKGVRA